MKTLPLIATSFGILKLIPKLLSEKKYSEYSLGVTVFTLISVCMWLIHYYRIKEWIPALEVLIVLVINLQILYVLLSKPKPEERSVFRQTSDGVYGYTLEGCTGPE